MGIARENELQDIVREIHTASTSERSNRVIDFETASIMEHRKKEGYF